MKLGDATAIVVGESPLAPAAATAVAGAGFGRIGLVAGEDADDAAVRLGAAAPEAVVEPYPVELDAANAEAIVAGADAVVAAPRAAAERELVNDACCAAGVALVAGGTEGPYGIVQSVLPGRSACLRCVAAIEAEEGTPAEALAGEPAEDWPEGAFAGVVAALEALEAVKLVTGAAEPLLNRVLVLDGREMSAKFLGVVMQKGCPGCSRAAPAPQS